jgi:hypothetical protein
LWLAASAAACAPVQSGFRAQAAGPRYSIDVDEAAPHLAHVRLVPQRGARQLAPARDGDGSGLAPACADGRPLVRTGKQWIILPRCPQIRWTVALAPIDGHGLDASLPVAGFSRRHRYWIFPERGGLLRSSDGGGSVRLRLRLADGRVTERNHAYPANNQPPFYAVAGARPALQYRAHGVTLNLFGEPPAFPWMGRIHKDVLATWARWRSDLVSGPSPAAIDWAWVEPPASLEPGYNASAGNEAIISQIRLREGDPDAEAKARAVIAASAAHEGFHTITGAAGQAWPAWVNESLANHYAIEAVRRFLAPSDFRFIEMFYIEPDVRRPLLEAQAAYAAGDGEQAQIFYIHGARFWRDIEQVLTVAPIGSGRLAALIKASDNFAGTDLNDAGALAALLDRHSGNRAGPIVRCYLQGRGCTG